MKRIADEDEKLKEFNVIDIAPKPTRALRMKKKWELVMQTMDPGLTETMSWEGKIIVRHFRTFFQLLIQRSRPVNPTGKITLSTFGSWVHSFCSTVEMFAWREGKDGKAELIGEELLNAGGLYQALMQMKAQR